MAELSHLGTLNPVEFELDLDNYAPAKESTFQLAPAGVYTLRAPDTFPDAAFSRTSKGNLQVQIDPTIVGPSFEDTVVRFVKISAKTFKRGAGYASQIGDYLKALGYKGVIKTEADIIDAVRSTAGLTYEAKLDWRSYNKRTGWSLEGMERFPRREDGTYQSFVVDPTEEGKTDENGRQLIVFANLTIPFGGFVAKG
jgi:hypothetical protein